MQIQRISIAVHVTLAGIVFIFNGCNARAAEDSAPKELLVNQSLQLTFTSGDGQETGRQSVNLKLQPGRYRLEFSQIGARYSDRWIIWDYLEMHLEGGKVVWKIGKDDVGRTPPDYSAAAFEEFARPGESGATNRFVVNQTESKQFIRELNDNDHRQCFVEFEITEQMSNEHLGLLISTLYSTHTGAREFRMKLKLQKL